MRGLWVQSPAPQRNIWFVFVIKTLTLFEPFFITDMRKWIYVLMDARRGIDRIKMWIRSLMDAILEGQVGVNIHMLWVSGVARVADGQFRNCNSWSFITIHGRFYSNGLCYGHKSSTGTVRRLFHQKSYDSTAPIRRPAGGRKNSMIFFINFGTSYGARWSLGTTVLKIPRRPYGV